MNYEFEMPWPPSVGSCWRVFRNRLILSSRGREYRKQAIERLKELGLYKELIRLQAISIHGFKSANS